MAGAGSPIATEYPNNQIFSRVYRTEKKGHKLPFFINFRKSPDALVNV